ncbi:MAG: phenylacetate-CoA oxygenase subunit PaaJ [Ignavibacteria bacterium]|nr:phenylacetate-CoA oxygenase subunit PaaJ [Ignavibacteria bacterium]
MAQQTLDEKLIWKELEKIADPEIPVLTLVEMKVIRSVRVQDNQVTVVISPTYVGCPAMDAMKDEIRSRLRDLGCEQINLETTFAPPWSTEMLDETTREKLRSFGIAPPAKHKGDLAATLAAPVPCPFCHSEKTHMESSFGPTLCRQIYYCDTCRQSFDRFKPL